MVKVFSVKRLVVMVGWSESLTWCVTTEKEQRTLYFSFHKVTENDSGNNAYGFILGPLTVMVGLGKR